MTTPASSIESATAANAVAAFYNCTATVGGASVGGIFDNGFAEIYGMDGVKPSLECASSDVTTAVRGTAVVVDGVSYTIASIVPDGTGMSKLLLEKV